ncbi:MAG TPA: hypothetical protein VK476_06920, partial [Flavobacterium sp.]|nr:hypothetical protein [Flavobacterium sp.]
FECKLSVPNNGNVDYYSFIVNADDAKSFEQNGADYPVDDSKILTLDKLLKNSSCEIHDFLSSERIYFIKRNGSPQKYKMWIPMYTGTYRNTVVVRQKGRL